MSTFRFRSLPTAGQASPKIDYKAGVIRGVSLMQAVEALGHGMLLDQTTLQQVAQAVNATGDVGIKSRFTHPGMCADGLGSQLGKIRNASVVGDKVLGDLHLMEAAKRSPKGDLYSYALEMARDNPADFGMSVVIEAETVWKLKDGSETSARDANGDTIKCPPTATSSKPFARVKKLCAVDLVDEPAANRDGLFSGTSSELGADLFHELDALLQYRGITLARAREFFDRYFSAREPTKPTPAQVATPSTDDRPIEDTLTELVEAASALGIKVNLGPSPEQLKIQQLRDQLARLAR